MRVSPSPLPGWEVLPKDGHSSSAAPSEAEDDEVDELDSLNRIQRANRAAIAKPRSQFGTTSKRNRDNRFGYANVGEGSASRSDAVPSSSTEGRPLKRQKTLEERGEQALKNGNGLPGLAKANDVVHHRASGSNIPSSSSSRIHRRDASSISVTNPWIEPGPSDSNSRPSIASKQHHKTHSQSLTHLPSTSRSVEKPSGHNGDSTVEATSSEESDNDKKPQGVASRTTQIARKSTGGRRLQPAMRTSPEEDSSSNQESLHPIAIAHKSTGGRNFRHDRENVKSSTSSASATGSNSATTSRSASASTAAKPPAAKAIQKPHPKPTGPSSSNIPLPSAGWSKEEPASPSPVHSVIVISSDSEEIPLPPPSRSRATAKKSTNGAKLSDAAKAKRVFQANSSTTSSIGALFSAPASPTKGLEAKDKGKAREGAAGASSWGEFVDGLQSGGLIQHSFSARNPQRPLQERRKSVVQGTLDGFVTTAPVKRHSPYHQRRESKGRAVQSEPDGEDQDDPMMTYTAPDLALHRQDSANPKDRTIDPSGPDMRPLETALGLSGPGESVSALGNRKKGKEKERPPRSSTPPNVVVKEQPHSPPIPLDKKGKGRATDAGPDPASNLTKPDVMSLANAIEEAGSRNHQASSRSAMNAIALKNKEALKPKLRRRRPQLEYPVSAPAPRLSGIGSKDDPLTLDDSDEDEPVVPPPRTKTAAATVSASGSGAKAGPSESTLPLKSSAPKFSIQSSAAPPALVGHTPVSVSVPQSSGVNATFFAPSGPAPAPTPDASSVRRPDDTQRSKTYVFASVPASAKPSSKAMKLKQMLKEHRNSSASGEKEAVSTASAITELNRESTTVPIPSVGRNPVTPVASTALGPKATSTTNREGDSAAFTQRRSASAVDRGSRSSSDVEARRIAKSTSVSSKASTPANADVSVSLASTSEVKASVAADDEDEIPLPPLTSEASTFGLEENLPVHEDEHISDRDAVMEVDNLLMPSYGSSPEIADITAALGSQTILGNQSGEQSHTTSRQASAAAAEGDSDHDSSYRASSLEDFSDPDFGNEADDENGVPISEEDRMSRINAATTLAPAGKFLAGYPVITFNDYRNELRNNPYPEVYRARDLQSELQDTINMISSTAEVFLPGERELFKAFIQEQTATDEPDAPLIDIINNIDDQPTPPWEFHYSNRMWLSDKVPPPDIKNLEGCDCLGKCDPKSKTCSCLKKQMKAREEDVGAPGDFAYDKAGRLKDVDCQYPIFECNALCGCDQECRNRVVQNGRKVAVSIQKTEHKGWGVFAGPKKIPKGTFLGIYAGELLTEEEGHARGLVYNKYGRTYLFDLDFYHLNHGNPDWETKYVVDAYHAGNFTRYLNHSCSPNCGIHPCYINEANIDKPLLVMFCDRDIDPYDEICFDYGGGAVGNDDDGEVKERSDAIYVPCRCGASNCKGKMFR